MAEDIVSSLFGLSPYDTYQKQQNQVNADAYRFAQMPAGQRGAMGMYQAGAGIGRIGSGMLGLENPEIAQAKAREAAISGIDMSNPESILQRAQQIQDPQLKLRLTMLAQQIKSKQLADAKEAQAQALALRKQDFAENQAFELKKMEAEARIRQNDEKIKDARTTAEERAALMKDSNDIRRELVATRAAMASSNLPKLKPGERYTADGNVEPIPGSDLYNNQNQKHGKQYAGVLAIDTKTENATKKIDAILAPENADAFNANFGGYNALATQYKPGKTQDVRQNIESLKSDLKSAGLELMRSGGGIGQMTEREWPIVEKMVDSISPTLSEKEARNKIGQIRQYLERIRSNAHEVYDSEWASTPFYRGAGKEPPQSGTWTAETKDDVKKLLSSGTIDRNTAKLILMDMDRQGKL